MPCAFERIVDRAGCAEQRDAVCQIIIRHAPPLHRVFPELTIRIRPARISKNDWKRYFTVAKIVADAKASQVLVGR